MMDDGWDIPLVAVGLEVSPAFFLEMLQTTVENPQSDLQLWCVLLDPQFPSFPPSLAAQARISENPSMCITTLSAKNLKDQIEFTMGLSAENTNAAGENGVLGAYCMDATCSLMIHS